MSGHVTTRRECVACGRQDVALKAFVGHKGVTLSFYCDLADEEECHRIREERRLRLREQNRQHAREERECRV